MPMAGLLMGTEGSELRGREVLSEMLSPVRTGGMHMEGEAAALKRKTAPLLRRRYPEKKERRRVLFFRSGLGFFFSLLDNWSIAKQGILFIRRRPEGARGLGRYVGRY